MRRQVITLAIAILCLPIGRVGAERAGSTALIVNVAPESRLTPRQIPLRFAITPDATPDVPSNVSMWVRALPGQSIHLRAALGTFSGPVGGPAPEVRWSGSIAGATSGGQRAACNSGSFETGSSAELVSGWTQSGTLACNVVWSVANAGNLVPGVYIGAVDLALTTE